MELDIDGVKNLIYVPPSITSSIEIYTLDTSKTYFVDQVTSGQVFTPALEVDEITDATLLRSGDTVGLAMTLSLSFTPTVTLPTDAKIIITLTEGDFIPDGGTLICEQTQSDGSFPQAKACTTQNHSDGSLSEVELPGLCPSGCTLNTAIYLTLSNLKNPSSVQPIEGTNEMRANTQNDQYILYGVISTTSIASLEPNQITNISIVRDDDKIQSDITLTLTFTHKTAILLNGIIKIELPDYLATTESGV